MGLAERRALKEFQDTYLAEYTKPIMESAGFDVPLEIDWDKITSTLDPTQYRNELYSTYFDPIAWGLNAVGKDDMGKEALKAGLKKIIITYDPATMIEVEGSDYNRYDKAGWPKFDDGVLYVNIKAPAPGPAANRGTGIQKSLEDKL